MDKKTSKNAPKRGVFPHLRPPGNFFQKSGSVTFVPIWYTNFMQKILKILRAVFEIFKDGPTDGWTTDMGDYIGPPLVNSGSKISWKNVSRKKIIYRRKLLFPTKKLILFL